MGKPAGRARQLNAAALCIVAAGVAAALHAGKLPPAMPQLRLQFGMTLVQVSLMVSAFQLAGLSLGIVGGMMADRFGPRRVMVTGLTLLALASGSALWASDPLLLLASRALESAGFILAVLPGPVLLRRNVPSVRLSLWLGIWSTYMPTGMGIALSAGPWLMLSGNWRLLWLSASLVALLVAVALVWLVAPDRHDQADRPDMRRLIVDTVTAPGPRLLALGFGCYAAQWMSVFSFLPTIYQQAGVAPALAGTLTAIAVLSNVVGNLSGGWLAHRRMDPAWVVALSAISMAVLAWLAFGSGAPFVIRYLSVVMLSAVGGLIPGTLFAIAPSLAPHAGAVSTTVGLMQQGSTLGQFVAPPVLAAVASGPQGWSSIWIATAGFAAANLLGAAMLWRVMRGRAGH